MTEQELKEFEYGKIMLGIIENYAYIDKYCTAHSIEFSFLTDYCVFHHSHREVQVYPDAYSNFKIINLYKDGICTVCGYQESANGEMSAGALSNTGISLVFDGITHYDNEVNKKLRPFALTEEEHFQYSLIYDLKDYQYYKMWAELLNSYTVPEGYIGYWYYNANLDLDKLNTVLVNIKQYRENLC